LIAQTEALRAKYDLEKPEDVEKAARELHDIQERWKTAAEAPRAQAQTLWHRYRQAADPIQAKARDFFAARAVEREANLKIKIALCERAEALADSTDWIKTAEEMKKLQAEWQASGPVPRPETRLVWKRFREACDRFFTRRNEDLAQRKEVWAGNQARKEALCARAEELADSREWEKTAAEMRRLQAEWKTIGPVRRSKSEALWQRFRTAADHFFDRYKRRDEIEIESRQADREGLITELEALFPAEGAEPGADLLEQVRSLRTRWNQSTTAVRSGADPLSGRFVAAMERLLTSFPEPFRGTELDVEASRQRMEKLVSRVENLVAGAEPKQDSPQDLAARLREALASNTIGGRGGEESKWRGMAEEVRQAQSSFARLVPVPGEAGRQLGERFHKACNRFFDQYRRKVPQGSGAPQRGRPVGAR
jgi:phage repressor protein C with HTH and peptisase S24 domain